MKYLYFSLFALYSLTSSAQNGWTEVITYNVSFHNQADEYKNQLKKVIKEVCEKALSEKRPVYTWSENMLDNKKMMSKDSIKTLFKKMNNYFVGIDTANSLTYKDAIIIKMDSSTKRLSIGGFQIIEEWTFNKDGTTLSKKVLGIAPFRKAYDENGNYVVDLIMFYLRYD